jgi:hypothetical protein
MAGITTAMCTTFKSDVMSGLHCFNATINFTATGVSTVTWTSVSSLVGLSVGMIMSGTNVAAGTVLASIDSATQITVSKASTGAIGTVTATADLFKIALFKVGVAGTYSAATTNYTDMTGSSDEVAAGGGYSTGGVLMTNVSPATSGTGAYVNFSPNPSWTSATFSTIGAMIYNNYRRGPVATRATSVYDFGGTQTVSAGTFTAVMPSAAPGTAILSIQ